MNDLMERLAWTIEEIKKLGQDDSLLSACEQRIADLERQVESLTYEKGLLWKRLAEVDKEHPFYRTMEAKK